jgi:hypothetical protein
MMMMTMTTTTIFKMGQGFAAPCGTVVIGSSGGLQLNVGTKTTIENMIFLTLTKFTFCQRSEKGLPCTRPENLKSHKSSSTLYLGIYVSLTFCLFLVTFMYCTYLPTGSNRPMHATLNWCVSVSAHPKTGSFQYSWKPSCVSQGTRWGRVPKILSYY